MPFSQVDNAGKVLQNIFEEKNDEQIEKNFKTQ